MKRRNFAEVFAYTFIITLLIAAMIWGLTVAYINSTNAMRPPSERIGALNLQIEAQQAELTVFGITKTLPLPDLSNIGESVAVLLLPAEIRMVMQGMELISQALTNN